MEISESFFLEALSQLKREILSDLHVALPGKIVSFDAASGTASVQPALLRQTASGAVLAAPVLPAVPVLMPLPFHEPAAGDPCLLIFCDCCLDGALAQGLDPVLPPSPRLHDLSDAVALVGFAAPALSSGSAAAFSSSADASSSSA